VEIVDQIGEPAVIDGDRSDEDGTGESVSDVNGGRPSLRMEGVNEVMGRPGGDDLDLGVPGAEPLIDGQPEQRPSPTPIPYVTTRPGDVRPAATREKATTKTIASTPATIAAASL
jgi:hypothetical protein